MRTAEAYTRLSFERIKTSRFVDAHSLTLPHYISNAEYVPFASLAVIAPQIARQAP